MKHQTFKTRYLASYAGVFALGAVLLSSTATHCQAASADPSGGGTNTWDCIFGGNTETGISYITFFSDFTFSGFEVIAPKPGVFNTNAPIDTGRGGSGIGRNTGSGGSTSGVTNAFLYGFGSFDGNWTTNINGNIIGSFERETANGNEAVSFVGKATYGKVARLTLVATTPEGKLSYRGVLSPPATAPELAGNWYAYATANGESVLEMFTLSDSGTPGLFDLVGSGPNYSTSGECVISSQRRIGFASLLDSGGSTNILRATVGSYSDTARAITTKTSGAQDPGVQARFQATLLK